LFRIRIDNGIKELFFKRKMKITLKYIRLLNKKRLYKTET
jgi:hypothetical protein